MAIHQDKLKNTQRDLMNQPHKGGSGPAADQHDGSFHDPVYWNGQLVEYVKDVGVSDPGYDGNKRQVMIITRDGKQKVIPEAEILREKRVAMETPLEADRPPVHPVNVNPAAPKPQAEQAMMDDDADKHQQAAKGEKAETKKGATEHHATRGGHR